MAMIDGMQNKISPGEPTDYDLFSMPEAEVPRTPSSLEAALGALAEDNAFLLRSGVFTEDVLETWIRLRRKELEEQNLRPHPHEFCQYFDV